MRNFKRELCRRIYEEYKERLHWYMCKWFAWLNPEDVHDIQQDTWRKLMENIEVVGLLSPPEQYNWLVKVCHNEAISFLRKQKRMVSEDSETLERLLKAKRVTSLENEVIDKLMLEEMMKKLSEDDRKVLYRNEFSVSKERKSNAENCKAYRVKQKLRKMWREGDSDA